MFKTFNLTLDIYYPRLASGNLQPLVKRLLPLLTIVRLAIFIMKITFNEFIVITQLFKSVLYISESFYKL